ncbi:MAG: Asp-tRNA(Asn)/Glu-tRNA(Gln) amidotransferase subunit GatC [bacterium]
MITEKDVEHMAALARLELSPEEKQLYCGQLGGILDWMEKLNSLDISGVESTSHVSDADNVMRDDIPVQSGMAGALLSNAPEKAHDFVKVRKVIE